MADIKKLQQDGEEFSPVTHEAAVLNDNNESIAVSYQTTEDDGLNTDDKSIVGAINEVNTHGIYMNNLSDVIEPGDPNNPILVRIEELEDTLVEYIENLINNSSNGTGVIDTREALYNMMIEDGYNEATSSMTVDELIQLLDDSQIDIGDIKQIACGGYHTFIIKNDDSVWCCGYNNYGQLGLGDTTDRTSFTQVTNINNVKQIICGYAHTFILKNDGSVWACGLNENGQLGLGDTTQRTIITQVVTNINNVKQIICGNYHTFILKNDGSVWSCGLNDYGRLGLGDTTDRSKFTQVTNINNVKQIICGYYHTFILKNDGTVWACGDNGLGQLGLNDTTDRTSFTQVTTNISDVKQISCGVHTVMLKNDGSVWATGYNSYGQLGLGDDTQRTTFTQVTTNINNDVKQVACGYYQTFILKNDGSVWACGENEYGQFGLGDEDDRNVFTQVTTNINNDVKQVACGGYFTSIIKNDGSLWSCGYNESGELGLGYTGTNITTFTQVPLLSDNEINRQKLYYYLLDNSISVTEDMDVNTMLNLLINNGTDNLIDEHYNSLKLVLIDEGVEIEEDDSLSDLIIKVDEEFDNKNNELNESMGEIVFSLSEFISDNGGTVTGEESLSELLNMIFEYGTLTLPVSYDIMPVAAGFDSSVLFKNDGSLWGCGVNSKGQLGVGHTSALNSFTQATVNISNDVVQVAAGNEHILVVKNNGELWGSGSNQYGQLGLGDTTSVSVFNKITSGVSDVKQIACGARHSMMVKNDGTLWACGYNDSGQLGLGNTTNQVVFTQISSMSNVAKVVCGYYHTLVLKEDGSVWVCGDNSKGQLGNSTTTNSTTFVRCIENVKDIFCGHYTSFVIKQDGTLWSCGQSDYGQIGRGDGFSTYSPNFEQVLDNVKTGSAGVLHTMVIRKDGTVWGCGYNGAGQQGNGTIASMNNFKQITTNTNDAVAIICGARHSILIKSDSSIWVTGQNTSGQLGTGNNTDIGTFTGLSISIGTGNNSGQPEPEPEEPAGPVFGDQQPNTWVTCDDIPTPRVYHVAETVDDKVYVIGGTINTSYTKTAKNECYDPYTNTWTQKTDAPSAKHGAASGMVGNKIYYMGGSATNVTNTNNCYDPSTNSWTSKASMTEAKYLMGYTTYNNKIYCVNGLPSGSANETNTNLCYDPNTNAWTSLRAIGTATRTPAVGVINGVMYVIGGYSYASGNVTLKNVYKYTISSNSVANGTSVNFDMEFTNAVALNNKLYMVKPYTKELLSFNGSSWTTVSSQMPYKGYRNVLAVADGKIISICGEDDYGYPVSDIVMYLPN